MALSKCKECGKDVSSQAKTCPHCGARQINKAGAVAAAITATLVFAVIGISAISTRSDPSSPASDSAAKNWVIDQLDPNHTVAKAQIQDCMATPGCDVTKPSASASPDQPETQAPEPSQGDPYANGQNKIMSADYLQRRASFLADAKMAYFAAGCRVIQEVEANVTVIDGTNALQQDAQNDGVTYDPALASLIPDAERAGVDQAKQQGAITGRKTPMLYAQCASKHTSRDQLPRSRMLSHSTTSY